MQHSPPSPHAAVFPHPCFALSRLRSWRVVPLQGFWSGRVMGVCLSHFRAFSCKCPGLNPTCLLSLQLLQHCPSAPPPSRGSLAVVQWEWGQPGQPGRDWAVVLRPSQVRGWSRRAGRWLTSESPLRLPRVVAGARRQLWRRLLRSTPGKLLCQVGSRGALSPAPPFGIRILHNPGSVARLQRGSRASLSLGLWRTGSLQERKKKPEISPVVQGCALSQTGGGGGVDLCWQSGLLECCSRQGEPPPLYSQVNPR